MLMGSLPSRTDAALVPSKRVEDVQSLRKTFGRFASGVTVVTCSDGESVHGMTANSFISVSLEPARALISIKRTAKMHDLIIANEFFGLSVLGSGQARISSHFAGQTSPDFVPHFNTVGGVPLIADAIAWMVCRRSQDFSVGDHTLFIGDLMDCDHVATSDPLLFFGGRYAFLIGPDQICA